MSSVNSVRAFSANLSQTLQQGAQQAAKEIQQNTDRLERKKENISQAALEQIQLAQSTSARLAESRNKIDTYA